MGKKLKKLDTRGGYRKASKLTDSQALLLKAIWEKHGGVSKAARKIGVHRQALTNWRFRGSVPLEMAGLVSRQLNILREGLCYEANAKLMGYSNDWKWVVNQYGLDKQTVKDILKGKHPTP